jgi:hypothetical protein
MIAHFSEQKADFIFSATSIIDVATFRTFGSSRASCHKVPSFQHHHRSLIVIFLLLLILQEQLLLRGLVFFNSSDLAPSSKLPPNVATFRTFGSSRASCHKVPSFQHHHRSLIIFLLLLILQEQLLLRGLAFFNSSDLAPSSNLPSFRYCRQRHNRLLPLFYYYFFLTSCFCCPPLLEILH